MAWVKVDDQFFSHPKVVRAGKDATLLYLAGLTYCSGHLTDGFIPAEAVRFLAVMVGADNEKQTISKLLDVGLWESKANGYQVHDYLEYNATREQALATKKARAEAGAKGGSAPKTPKEKQNESKSQAKAKQKPSNIPSHPITTPSNDGVAPAEDDPIKFFHEVTGKYPPKELYQKVTEVITARRDPVLLRECMEEWAARGYNRSSLQWFFDWYRSGQVPPKKGQNTGSNGYGQQGFTGSISSEANRRANAERLAIPADKTPRARPRSDAGGTGLPGVQGNEDGPGSSSAR